MPKKTGPKAVQKAVTQSPSSSGSTQVKTIPTAITNQTIVVTT